MALSEHVPWGFPWEPPENPTVYHHVPYWQFGKSYLIFRQSKAIIST